ncbi:TetR/AcrR family transcriptional regulator [Williamsia muralis]|uniref:TetR/AcrR family transcriptional regulator n=1 Tax=Williamsia marianensis TaxID=85044 RepID=UPI003F5CEEC4
MATSSTRAMLERAYKDAIRRTDAGDDTTRTRLLDAAYEQFCRTGVQRTSMEDVARRANMSRITVYRRFATKDALIEQVIFREFRRYFERFLTDIRSADTAAERVVLGFVSSLRAIRGNPMIGGLIDAEPGLVAGSMIGDDGRMVAAVREFVAGQLRREQQVGNVDKQLNIDLIAEMMVRISASFLTIRSDVVDLDDDKQLAAIAWQFLVPMLDVGRLPK